MIMAHNNIKGETKQSLFKKLKIHKVRFDFGEIFTDKRRNSQVQLGKIFINLQFECSPFLTEMTAATVFFH